MASGRNDQTSGTLNAPVQQKNDDILRCEPVEVVDMALGRLQRARIVLLEWHSLLYHRMNVPVLICHARRAAKPSLGPSLFDEPPPFAPLDAPSDDRQKETFKSKRAFIGSIFRPHLRSYSTWHSIRNHFPPSTTLKSRPPITLLPLPCVNRSSARSLRVDHPLVA